ncbi:MAG TPA: TonB-dependent receptor [Sphingobium sp.]|nr:TonB-dependent receptor [Sphingobium sp.]
MRTIKIFEVLAITCVAGGTPLAALQAQQPGGSADVAPAGDGGESGDIVILGRGLALPPGTLAYGSVTLERDQLLGQASGLLEGALADVAGFQQFRRSDSRSANPSSQGVTLRALGGNATSRALVILDGVPQADPFFGSVPFTALMPERLGAVRVTRGGGAGAFGAGTVAGTIELFSADRHQLPEVQASAFYGSRNAQDLSLSVSPDVGAGFVSISGKYARGDGFQTTPADQQNAATVPARYENWSVSLYGVAPVGRDGEIQSRVTVFRDDRTLRFAGADSGQEGQDASLRFLWRGDWQIEALGYVQFRNFDNIVISSSSFRPVLDQRNTPSTGVGGKIELRPPTGPNNVLRIGADTRVAIADMLEDAINGGTGAITARRAAHGRQVTTGFYIEDDLTLGNVVLTAGARADRWTVTQGRFVERNGAGSVTTDTRFADRDDWEASVRGGVLWHAVPGVDLRAAGYTSFRLPTLNELYRSFAVFPVTTQANAALAPERLRGAEVGIDLHPLPGLRFSATAFYNRLGNAIANVTIGTNLRQRQNVDAIVAKGIELTGSAQLGDFDLDASYAYNDSRVKASGPAAPLDGLRPAQSPRHMASGTLGWNGPAGFRLAGTLRYTGPQFEDDLQTDVLPGVVTVDGYASIPLAGGFTLVGRVENAFDATVLTRKVGNSIDLGAPRTFWIGISFGK